MRFRQFLLFSEQGPGAPPAGGPPMGGAGGPMAAGGGPPMGGAGGLGGDPMGGGMGAPPMGGASPSPTEPPVVPIHGDVWDVLDSILNSKPIQHEQQRQRNQQAGSPGNGNSGMAGPAGGPGFGGMDQSAGMGLPATPMGATGAPPSGPMNSALMQ